MRFLPYQRLTLHAHDPPEVVAARLTRMVATRWFYLKQPAQPFRGSIQEAHFKVVRDLGPFWWNSFRPVVLGDIAAVPGGTEVRVRMRLAAFVAAFMALWFGFLGFGTAVMVWNGLREGLALSAVAPGLLVFPLMALPAYLLVSWGFWTEVKVTRSLLAEGLGCRVAEARSTGGDKRGIDGPAAGASPG